MRRRDFLRQSAWTVAGLAGLPGAFRGQRHDALLVPEKAISDDGMIGAVEKLVPNLMRDASVPGVSIAIIRNGKLIWQRGFGLKDRESNAPVDEKTVFESASISKTVFAYMVMKLCEKGVIGLDVPLVRYSSKRFLEGDPRIQFITARHVLSHTTGFHDWRARDNPLQIHFTPGSHFDYSGEGYYYLQSVVSQLIGHVYPKVCAKYECGLEVCATDFEATMKQRILTPFGMNASGYVWNDFFAVHCARPHDELGRPLTKARASATDAARYGSAGGLQTTVSDYAKFLIEVIDPKPSDEFRLGRASLNEMVRPQIKLDKEHEIDGASAWALGWAIQERSTGNVILHSGGQTGFRTLTMASVERKSGFVIFTNSDNGAKVCYDIPLGTVLTPLIAG